MNRELLRFVFISFILIAVFVLTACSTQPQIYVPSVYPTIEEVEMAERAKMLSEDELLIMKSKDYQSWVDYWVGWLNSPSWFVREEASNILNEENWEDLEPCLPTEGPVETMVRLARIDVYKNQPGRWFYHVYTYKPDIGKSRFYPKSGQVIKAPLERSENEDNDG